jgi:general stress protein 26
MCNKDIRPLVEALLTGQLFAVLATQGDAGRPHLSIVSFLSADSLRSLIFVTPRKTRKYGYLRKKPEAALFIDDRREKIEDIMQVTGIEAAGSTTELAGEERAAYRSAFLSRFPGLSDFYDSPENAVIRIAVEEYNVVDNFQNMRILKAEEDF